MRIDLLLDLAHLERAGNQPPRAPALEMLIARGDAWPAPVNSLTDCLLGLFDVPREDAPVAALSLLGDGIEPGEDYWLRADPVCLQATRTRLLCAPLPQGELSPAEAQAVVCALEPHVASAGHALLIGHPQRWYLRCPLASDLRTQPPPTTSRVFTEEMLPSGADGPQFRRLMTEAQMLLHSLDTNSEREANGRPPVNGIWLWGGGRFRGLRGSPYSAVMSDDPLARGLARAAGCAASNLPDSCGDALARAEPQSTLLIAVTPDGAAPLSLPQLDAQWVQPLLRAFGDGRLHELRILAMGEREPCGRRVVRRHLRRWWRRARPFRDHA